MNNNPNDPNQPPYGQQSPEPDELPPTQYAPQPSPYEQEPVQPPEPDELPPTQYTPQPPPYGQQPVPQPPYQGQAPAYGQQPPSPPYRQQPPPYGQQPQYGGVPPIPVGYAAPPPQKKSLKWLWITLSIVGTIFVLACAGGVSLLLFANLGGPDSAAQNYYNAVEKQDYATAYNYFAPGASFTDTQSGKTLQIPTEPVYVTVAESVDKEYGILTNYQTKTSSGSDNKHIIATLTRSGQQYQANLTMTQVDGNWKILNFDSF
jgi:hypothetical protein